MTNTGPSAPYVSQSLRWREDMTQHQLPAALSAPLRVVLYENRAGRATFECDRTLSLFGQFGEERATGSRAPIGYQSRARAGQAAS